MRNIHELHVTNRKRLRTTPVFETYWRFAAERQHVFMQRVAGSDPPWTTDQILRAHRFTNVYRASDRISQYLIRHVIYSGSQVPEEVFFRTILFKFFNRIETWEELTHACGTPTWQSFDCDLYSNVLDSLFASGQRIYSAAYIMPSPSFGNVRKHRNHLQLLEYIMRDGAPWRISRARSLRDVFMALRTYPSLGDFLAFQFTVDLNYTELIDFSEMEFVVAGPGARDGIRKCFSDTGGLSESDIIRVMTEYAETEFLRLDLTFQKLWGRDLQLIDCQNLFCEVSKYARLAHPEMKDDSGRTRIKQRFTPRQSAMPQWYPPKWRLSPMTNVHSNPDVYARIE